MRASRRCTRLKQTHDDPGFFRVALKYAAFLYLLLRTAIDGFPLVGVRFERWSSVLFTPRAPSHRESIRRHLCLTCPSVPTGFDSSSTAHPPHVSLLSRPGTGPGIRPVIRSDRWRTGHHAPFSCRLSAAGIRFLGVLSRPEFRPPYGRPTAPPPRRRGPERGLHVPQHETRLGWGVLCTPRATVSTRPKSGARSPPAASQRPAPVTPAPHFRPGMLLSRGINKDSLHSPVQPSPHLWPPRRGKRPLGFPMSFTPPDTW